MSKSKILLSVAGFVVAAAIGFPVQAGGGGGGGGSHNDKECKGGQWDRVKVWKARCEKEAKRVDRDGNEDDWVCEKYSYGNIRYRDNND
jgi:hypothetical protein